MEQQGYIFHDTNRVASGMHGKGRDHSQTSAFEVVTVYNHFCTYDIFLWSTLSLGSISKAFYIINKQCFEIIIKSSSRKVAKVSKWPRMVAVAFS